jgi:hypothetical protein
VWPTEYRRFIEQHNLTGREVEIPERNDLSGVGASIELFNETDALEESADLYPGLVVVRDGFVPIGGCMIGSGDPYFINVNDRQPGPVYRIYHDAVLDESYDRNQAIVRILESYEELAQYVQPQANTG